VTHADPTNRRADPADHADPAATADRPVRPTDADRTDGATHTGGADRTTDADRSAGVPRPDGSAVPGAGGPTTTFAGQVAAVGPDPVRAGRYRVDVDPGWICPTVPQGGLMAALAARAMTLELGDPALALRSLTTVFAAPVPAGPVTVDVEVHRRGRSMAQVTATTRPAGGGPGHILVAVFGRSRPGFALTDRVPPEVPSPGDCPSFDDPAPDGTVEPPVPFWQLVEGRPALGHAPWDPSPRHRSDCAYWYRFREPPCRTDGTYDPLALVTLCDTMPGTIGERVGGEPLDWWGPSADLTVHVLGEARGEWLLGHVRAGRAGDGYASADIDLWDAAGDLVAHGTQVMFFTFPGGAPDPALLVPADQRAPG